MQSTEEVERICSQIESDQANAYFNSYVDEDEHEDVAFPATQALRAVIGALSTIYNVRYVPGYASITGERSHDENVTCVFFGEGPDKSITFEDDGESLVCQDSFSSAEAAVVCLALCMAGDVLHYED